MHCECLVGVEPFRMQGWAVFQVHGSGCPDIPDTRIAYKQSTTGGASWSSLRILHHVEVWDLTTWTILKKDDPNHFRLRCNALPEHQIALITSGCVSFRGAATSSRRRFSTMSRAFSSWHSTTAALTTPRIAVSRG